MSDLEQSARLATWTARTIGKALVIVGVCVGLSGGVALIADNAAFIAWGFGLGFVIAGVTLKDANAAQEVGRP